MAKIVWILLVVLGLVHCQEEVSLGQGLGQGLGDPIEKEQDEKVEDGGAKRAEEGGDGREEAETRGSGWERVKLGDLTNRIKCLDKSAKYRARPDKLVDVEVSLSILSISGLDLEKMEFRVELYLTQKWEDQRCRFRTLPGQGNEITLQGHGLEDLHNLLNHLWMPDTYIANAREVMGHENPQPLQTTRVKFDGLVTHSTRLTVTASCPMSLWLFPMDTQSCSLLLHSYSFNSQQVAYQWGGPLTWESSLEHQDRMMPELRLLGYSLANNQTARSRGREISQLRATFYMERPLGHYLFDIYLPAACIVFMSWINFCLSRSAGPERVGLGMTIVLTLTTLMANANANLPKTSYPKAIGVYLSICFIFTFAGLVENLFAAAEKRKDKAGRSRGRGESKRLRPESGTEDDLPEGCKEDDLPEGCKVEEGTWFWPRSVDRKSRRIFPLTFLLFNVVYWTTCLASVQGADQELVTRQGIAEGYNLLYN